jgi:hypothetical protein
MKRLFLAFLAITFLAPAAGSVFAMAAMDTDHHASTMVAAGTVMEDMEATDTACAHQEKHAPIDLDCCNPELTHSKVGIWERGSGEKTVLLYFQAHFATVTDTSYAALARHALYFSTAPPPHFQDYCDLVGIVKRLD